MIVIDKNTGLLELANQPETLLIRVHPGVSATVVETAQAGRRVRIVEAGEGARVRFISLQTLGTGETLEESLESQAETGSTVHFFNFQLGGALVKSRMAHHAQGSDATCHTDLMTRTAGAQDFSFILENDYARRGGRGVITAKGVAGGKSRLSMHGTIKIRQLAGGTDCHLAQAILNLSPEARVKATPALEIDTNDVKASHSASVQNLNDETLFYLQARGIDSESARQMLTMGFLRESIDKLSDLPELLKRIYSYL